MSVLIVGTLDTKGEEIDFTRQVIEGKGVETHVVDAGVVGEPAFEGDTPRERVADLGGEALSALQERADRGHAVEVMAAGATEVAMDLLEDGVVDGVLGLGGSGGTSIGTSVMRALPYGIPKVMVSTMASGDTRPYVGSRDIMMMYSVADIEGLNQLTRRILSNAALALVGMVSNEPPIEEEDRLTIGITMFGVTTPCAQRARAYLEDQGYETIVFHATGTGGEAMEGLVKQGIIDGVLDVTTTELADELVGGDLSAGPDRLEAAGETGVPQVVSTGALDMVNFGPMDSVPEKFADRKLHVHNPQVTLMRTTAEENAQLGAILAEKLNKASCPTTVVLPLRGVSMIDVEGEDFYDPEADTALYEAIKDHLDPSVELIELETDINDEEFALTMARTLDRYFREEE